MKIQEAMDKARLDAIRENFERLSSSPEWDSLTRVEKYARMELECGCSRQTYLPYLKEMGIEIK